jgi:glycosyltransferase involved in cell wall biosynthesis
MNLGIATPVSLQRLRPFVANGEKLPPGYLFAPAADWVKELMKSGHSVTLYTTAQQVSSPITFHGSDLRIRIASQRASGTGRDFFALERGQLKEMMVEDRCDLIHAHWTYEFALAAIASGCPTLITIHDHPWKVLRHFRDGHRAARLLMAYMAAHRGKHFTAVSSGAASHFRRYIRPGKKIEVIPNGLSKAIFALGRHPQRRVDAEVTFATVLQGWSRLKNASTALRAFAIVRREIPDAGLKMFGTDFEQDGPAQQWALANGLAENVSFAGVLPYEELWGRIEKEIDVVVHPSLNETFSMTVLEAMALKKPVVVGLNTSGMREMLGEESGCFTNVTNPEVLARSMLCLAKDANLRDQMATHGYERASKFYRLDIVTRRYEEMYKEVLKA